MNTHCFTLVFHQIFRISPIGAVAAFQYSFHNKLYCFLFHFQRLPRRCPATIAELAVVNFRGTYQVHNKRGKKLSTAIHWTHYMCIGSSYFVFPLLTRGFCPFLDCGTLWMAAGCSAQQNTCCNTQVIGCNKQ